MDILKHAKMPQSLSGITVRPMSGAFSGSICVPKRYFTEDRSDQEAALAFLEDEKWEDAMMVETHYKWVDF